MTDHADISRRLALAIGWPENAVYVTADMCFIWFGRDGYGFDYRDPAVIWPIAERYNAFPVHGYRGFPGWGLMLTTTTRRTEVANFDTAAEAVASAVIGSKG